MESAFIPTNVGNLVHFKNIFFTLESELRIVIQYAGGHYVAFVQTYTLLFACRIESQIK